MWKLVHVVPVAQGTPPSAYIGLDEEGDVCYGELKRDSGGDYIAWRKLRSEGPR